MKKDDLRTIRKCLPMGPGCHRMRRREPNFFLVLALVCLGIAGMSSPVGSASTQGEKQGNDAQRLAGRWVRSDGGYILELRNIHKDGGMEAFYFNPRPIRVSEAVWARREGKITLMVELRDVNYPGSTYNLQYDPKADRLKGTYFQAVEKLTFDVQFERAR